jgi:peptidoglycan/LPS O-acetylase OafA/YrhL
MPALDGLRGFAVLAVLVFHGGFSWAVGGFLGVSLFFTLSGFLICSLLLAEHSNTGHIRLGAFWARRVRRLLPAALIALALIALFGVFVATPVQRLTLAGDMRSALFDFSNWRFLATGHGYADIFRDPSPVQHFWSLSIEEQFYLFFPPLVALTLSVSRGSRRVLGAVLTTAAAGALAVQLTSSNPDRIYYGTDARAIELLAGALLAIVAARWVQHRSPIRPPWAWVLAAVGVAAAVLTVRWWSNTAQTDAWLYDGGFGLVGLVNVALIAGAVVRGPLQWLCSNAPIRYIGRISYGLYLYHWPVFLWLDADRVGLEGWALFGVRMAVTGAIAVASFYFVEWPIRQARSIRAIRLVPAVATAMVVVAVVTVVALPKPDAASVITAKDFSVARDIPKAPPPQPSSAPSSAIPKPLRVYVAGDSTGVTLAGGLGLWSVGSGAGQVVLKNDAAIGCGFQRFGTFRTEAQDGGLLRNADICDHMPERWQRDIAEFQPDVVLMVSGPFNVLDFQSKSDGVWRAIGDPIYDASLEREMKLGADILGSTGKPVIWFDLPYSDRAGWNDPARADRYNAFVRQLDAEYADVTRLNWAKYVNGLSLDQRFAIRPDGVHVDPSAVPKVLDDWLWKAILAKYRTLAPRVSASPAR